MNPEQDFGDMSCSDSRRECNLSIWRMRLGLERRGGRACFPSSSSVVIPSSAASDAMPACSVPHNEKKLASNQWFFTLFSETTLWHFFKNKPPLVTSVSS
jgi:hypothetical protein